MNQLTAPRTPLAPVCLIGAPTDVGASRRGASMGPEALRVAGLAAALQGLGRGVVDGGDLSGPANPQGPVQAGYRHLHEVIAWNRSVHEATLASLRAGQLPVLLGGDHSVAIGSISAVARHCREQGKRLRVLWLDAHADVNVGETTPSGNLHGMPVSCLCGLGPEALTTLGGPPPALQPAELRQIGLRSVDPAEKLELRHLGIEAYDMRFIDEHGMAETLRRALAGLDEHTHLHVSLDADFLDPDIAPGVGTAVPGGPGYREAQLCMEMVADTGLLGSLDVVELNPACDVRNQTAECLVAMIESLLGKSVLLR